MGSCKGAALMLSFGFHGKKKKRKDNLISIFSKTFFTDKGNFYRFSWKMCNLY